MEYDFVYDRNTLQFSIRLAAEHEDIKVHLLQRTEAMQLLAEQKIDNAASVIALQWLALNLDKVKQAWGA